MITFVSLIELIWPWQEVYRSWRFGDFYAFGMAIDGVLRYDWATVIIILLIIAI